MAIDNLREFLAAIDESGELVRVRQPVRARLEIAEIADRCMKSPGGGPALLFEQVLLEDGSLSPHSVAINLYGSMRRICLALGCEQLDEIGGRIDELLHLKVPEGLFGKLAMLPRLAEIAKFPPGSAAGAPPARRSCSRARQSTSTGFRSSRPGPGTAGGISRCRWWSPPTRPGAFAT